MSENDNFTPPRGVDMAKDAPYNMTMAHTEPIVTYDDVKKGAQAFLNLVPRRWALGPMESEIIVQQIFEAVFGTPIPIKHPSIKNQTHVMTERRNVLVSDVANLKTLQYFADTAASDDVSFVAVRTQTLLEALEFVWSLLPSYMNPNSEDWDHT